MTSLEPVPYDIEKDDAAYLSRANWTPRWVVDAALMTADEARAWRLAGVAATEAAHWLDVQVRTPDQRPAGLGPDDVSALLGLGVSERSAGWAGVGGQCEVALRVLLDSGKPAAQITAMLRWFGEQDDERFDRMFAAGEPISHCTDSGDGCGFTLAVAADCRRLVHEAADVDWSDLATCLAAGLTLDAATGYLRESRDMGPVRVMAALA